MNNYTLEVKCCKCKKNTLYVNSIQITRIEPEVHRSMCVNCFRSMYEGYKYDK